MPWWRYADQYPIHTKNHPRIDYREMADLLDNVNVYYIICNATGQ